MSFCVGVGFYVVSPQDILLWVPFCGWIGGWFLEAPLNSIHLFTPNFYTNLLHELDYLSILANTFIEKATMKTISKIPTLYCSISKISDPGKRIQFSFVSKVSIVTNFELLNFPY